VEQLLEAAQRDANQRFLDIDAHIGNFLKFMMEPSGDFQGLEQRLRNAMRQAATPEEAERRLRYLEDQAAAFIGFRQDSPNMGFVNDQIEMIRRKATDALARADRAEEAIRQLPIQQLRDEVAEQQEAQADLDARVSGLEQTSREHGATSHTLSEKINACTGGVSIHPRLQSHLGVFEAVLRVLFPSANRLKPMFNTSISPLVLHSTLFSLRRLSDSSRHTPPQSGPRFCSGRYSKYAPRVAPVTPPRQKPRWRPTSPHPEPNGTEIDRPRAEPHSQDTCSGPAPVVR
jgi:hypothetical protein